MFKWLLIVLLVIIAALGGAILWLYLQSAPVVPVRVMAPERMTTESNTTVIVHESAINDLLGAIFPIEGQGKLFKKPLEIAYSWRVENPRVEITQEGPILTAEARVHILGKTHVVNAQGKGEIRYDSTAQDLFLDLRELRAHTNDKVLGIPLDRLNLAPPSMNVRLLGRLPLRTQFVVKKPEDLREEVKFAIVGHRIKYENQRVVVDLKLQFSPQREYREVPAQASQNK